jgi:hypothetical protein
VNPRVLEELIDSGVVTSILRETYASARAQSQTNAQKKSYVRRPRVEKKHAHDATTGCRAPMRAW